MRCKFVPAISVMICLLIIPLDRLQALPITVSGSFDSVVQVIKESLPLDPKQPNNKRSVLDTLIKFQLLINPHGIVDGIDYGAKLRLNSFFQNAPPYPAINYDRALGYLRGTFGTITIGTNSPLNWAAAANSVYGASGAGGFGPDQYWGQNGISLASHSSFSPAFARANAIAGSYLNGTLGVASQTQNYAWFQFVYQSAVIGYYDSFGTVQFAVAYSPKIKTLLTASGENTHQAQDGGARKPDNASFRNGIEATIRYDWSADASDGSAFSISLRGGGVWANPPAVIGHGSGNPDSSNANFNSQRYSIRSYGVSTAFWWQGVSLNLVFANGGKSTYGTDAAYQTNFAVSAPTAADTKGWSCQLGYSDPEGRFSFGGYFGRGQTASDHNRTDESGKKRVTDKLDQWGLGGQYRIFRGLYSFVAIDRLVFQTGGASPNGLSLAIPKYGSWTDKATVLTMGNSLRF